MDEHEQLKKVGLQVVAGDHRERLGIGSGKRSRRDRCVLEK